MSSVASRNISTSIPVSQIIKLSRLRVVDNSEIRRQAMMEGRPSRCIHVYNKREVGYNRCYKRRKEKGCIVLVGLKQQQVPKIPKFDTHRRQWHTSKYKNTGAIPHILRTKIKEKTHSKGADYIKLIAIASRFV